MSNKQKAEGGSKRAHVDAEEGEEAADGYSTSSSYAPSAIDVSFDYVAPSEIDFVALKRLVQQLYHTHALDIDLGALADHIIRTGSNMAEEDDSRAVVGTVVKVEDDEDSDPFAFASAIELNGDSPAAKTIRAYYEKVLSAGAAGPSSPAKAIASVLSASSSHVVQLFHERMINMPPQIMPALYRILIEEINAHPTMQRATHLLLFSRVFSTEAFSDDEDEEMQEGDRGQLLAPRSSSGGKGRAKKAKKMVPKNKAITKVSGADVSGGAADAAEEVGLFHPEDTIFAKHALHTFTFRFPSVKDSDDSFNAPMFGRIVLIKNDSAQIKSIIAEIAKAFAVPA